MFRWSILSVGLILGGMTGLVAAPLTEGQTPTPMTALEGSLGPTGMSSRKSYPRS